MSFFDVSAMLDLEPVSRVLAELCDRATRCGVEIMVVGATARDLLIRRVIGSPPQRATADVDIAVAVASWADVECLTAGLPGRTDGPHAFTVRGVPVDVIPFGAIEKRNRTVAWPNDHIMSVLGFREASASAVNVTLPGDVRVAVASLPAQSLLKLFAWRDRRYQDRRDAIDLRAILRAYSDGRYLDELYADHQHLLVKHEFDWSLAGAERLGREAGAIIGSSNRPVVAALLAGDQIELLAADMGGVITNDLELLTAYRDGVS
jgi:predicted nucleotidyltransferase